MFLNEKNASFEPAVGDIGYSGFDYTPVNDTNCVYSYQLRLVLLFASLLLLICVLEKCVLSRAGEVPEKCFLV